MNSYCLKNYELLKISGYWVDHILKSFVLENGLTKASDKGQTLSHPFYFGVSQRFIQDNSKIKIMIIGQEARGYGQLNDGTARYDFLKIDGEIANKCTCYYECNKNENFKICADYLNCPINSQRWAIGFYENQIFDNIYVGLSSYYKGENELKRRGYVFWNTLRAFYDNDFVPCWNNLDKVYYGKQLTLFAEKILSAQYSLPHETIKKSLIQREIEEVNPDAIIFLTGPAYSVSMETAFGLSEGCLGKSGLKPDKYSPFNDITDILQIKKSGSGRVVPVIWSYHPNYINRIADIDKVVLAIKAIIKDKLNDKK